MVGKEQDKQIIFLAGEIRNIAGSSSHWQDLGKQSMGLTPKVCFEMIRARAQKIESILFEKQSGSGE